MSALPRCRGRRSWIVTFLAIALVLALATAAYAYWSATGNTNISGAAGSVGAGQKPTFSVSGRDVTLSWGAATNASSYTVARTNVSPGSLSTTLNGSCAGTVSGTSCTDTALPLDGTNATTWTYTDRGKLASWTGAASPASDTVTIPGPSLSLGTTSFTTGGGTTSATVANFFDNEGVTYCVDSVQFMPCRQDARHRHGPRDRRYQDHRDDHDSREPVDQRAHRLRDRQPRQPADRLDLGGPGCYPQHDRIPRAPVRRRSRSRRT